MYKKNNTKKIFLCIILILVLFIVIGAASLATNLTINGIANVGNNTWDIHFDNIQVAEGSTPIQSGGQAATIDNNDNTLITFGTSLSLPGDYYEFNADIVNVGTLDGMIEKIEVKVNNQEISTLPSCIKFSLTYADNQEIKPNHLLQANQMETIKVRVEYKKDISNDELLTTNTSLAFPVQITYSQSNDNAFARPIYIYRNDEVESIVGETVSLEGTYYTTEEDMLNHTSSPFFLRHTIGKDNKIKQSHIGVYFNGTIYYIPGGGATYDPNTNTYDYTNVKYAEAKEIMLAAFADGNCDGDGTYTTCQGSVGFSWLDEAGRLNVNDMSKNCRIDSVGWSNCVPM